MAPSASEGREITAFEVEVACVVVPGLLLKLLLLLRLLLRVLVRTWVEDRPK